MPIYEITIWDAIYMIEHKACYTEVLVSGLGLQRWYEQGSIQAKLIGELACFRCSRFP